MPQAIPSHDDETAPRGIIQPPPPRPTVGDAMRRYWPLIVLAVLVLGGFGAYVGHSRTPTYKATASLSVGLVDLNTQSVPGFAVGSAVVAGGYSRSVQTDAVVLPIARQLHMSPVEVRGRVSSTPVPNSPIFTVTATGASAGEAVALANATSRSMIAYGRNSSAQRSATSRLLDRYREAVRSRNRVRARVARLTAAGASDGLSRARADLDAQDLRVQSLGQQYRTQTEQPTNNAVIQRVVDAQGASSDQRSTTQLYGVIGALVGVCVGVALAVLLAGWRYRRQRRRFLT